MKQIVFFCLVVLFAIFAVTAAAGVLTFQELQKGTLSQVLQVEFPEEAAETETYRNYGMNHGAESLQYIDIRWLEVEPQNDAWEFSSIDSQLNEEGVLVMNIFTGPLPSPDIPWTEAIETTMSPDAFEYVEEVVGRYAKNVDYWYLADSMIGWSEQKNPDGTELFPVIQQSAFLEEVADIIREKDPKSQIILPSIGEPTSYSLESWMTQMLLAREGEWFDVISYDYRGEWTAYKGIRDVLEATVKVNDSDQALWLWNSQEDLRVFALSSALGDVYYGVSKNEVGLLQHIEDFNAIEQVDLTQYSNEGVNVISYDDVYYIAWGTGEFTVPSGVSEIYTFIDTYKDPMSIEVGASITLTAIPVILK